MTAIVLIQRNRERWRNRWGQSLDSTSLSFGTWQLLATALLVYRSLRAILEGRSAKARSSIKSQQHEARTQDIAYNSNQAVYLINENVV